MEKQFTKQFMHENRGCYSEAILNDCDFMKFDEPITLDMILDSDIKLKHKYWFVCFKLLTKEQNRKVAIGVAEILLEIYENKYPNDKRPREAIQAAKDYLVGTINLDELKTKRDAAAYASYEAGGAYAGAAYAAACDNAATDYIYAAVDAAAYAANDYVFDAAAKTTVKDFNKLLLDYLKQFCK